MEPKILDKLTNASLTKQKLAQKVIQNPTLIPEIITGVSSSKPAIRYGCGKILLEISKDQPELLYPHMDFFIDLLDSKYRILTWSAIIIIANLARVDAKKKFDKIFDKYYQFLENDYMVTVANVVGNSWKIAVAKPYLTTRITDTLLTVEHRSTTPHLSEECKRVICEHAINSFDMFFPQIEQKEKVLMFVKQQLTSPRESLKCAAEKFLKKWS
jgi:hypothetical protein